ncbi:MAG: hypothetical protein Q9160_002344 [Pyrenula sp. 1 TL-2023]
MASAVAPSSSAAQDGANRRKSGRQTRKPELFAQEEHLGSVIPNGSAKRKRAPNGVKETEPRGDGGKESSSEEEEEEEESADEEELKEKRRASRNKKAAKKPAAKKAKVTNGIGSPLAIRTAPSAKSKAPNTAKVQKARSRPSQMNREGLYADVFGRGMTGEVVAAEWLQKYEQNNVDSMRDMVNFVLKCTGSNLQIDSNDIEDVDNVTSKLGDLQEEYQQENPGDYPLISRLKQYSAFRPVLLEFFDALIKSMHASTILYTDSALFENIQQWVDTMSSSGIRPFRHTATVISLTMSNAFCDLAKSLDESIARTRGQLEGEKKKKAVNKARVANIQQNLQDAEEKLDSVQALLKDEFDVVFVHRYRDVDPKIRAECVMSLGYWILTYRQMFLEGQYLRYLGWVLSDTSAQTRGEVIKQLLKMFKDRNNRPALRAFTERFRSRIVEMATADAEPAVRASTVELLELLRQAEFLEPDDIDAVGKLIFDAEPRVRKAVSNFFVANVDGVYVAKVEDLEEEQIDDFLPATNTDGDYLTPKRSWMKFKCLAETLTAYDEDGDEDDVGPNISREMLVATSMDSRYMLATQSIYPHMDELKEWEELAGYLLYDHSSIDAESLQGLYKLEEGEEALLLEVLDYAVKLQLVQSSEPQTEKKGRKTQKTRDEILEKQELTAHNLTQIVPKLLNKFGSTPSAASAILRLEHLLNVDLINDLQSSTTTYLSLLDDINRQFLTHSDRNVLAEASVALLNARHYEQAKDATESKVQDLWDKTVESLQRQLNGQNVETRGSISPKVMKAVTDTVSKLANLASISDFSISFETSPKAPTQAKSNRQRSSMVSRLSPLELLLELAKRGVADKDTTEQFVEVEDELSPVVLKTLILYFMWKAQNLLSALKANDISSLASDKLTSLAAFRDSFSDTLNSIIHSRPLLDPIRLIAITTILDLFTLFSTLRNTPQSRGSTAVSASTLSEIQSLSPPISPQTQSLILRSHTAAEKSFARKSKKTLEPDPSSTSTSKRKKPQRADTDAPIDSDDDNANENDNENEDEALAPPEEASSDSSSDADNISDADPTDEASRAQSLLIAEQSLCEMTGKIVLGVIAKVVSENAKERVLRNRGRLGPNYREVVTYLDESRGQGGKAKAKKPAASSGAAAATKEQVEKEKQAQNKQQKPRKSEPLVIEEDDIVDPDPDEDMDVEEDGEEDLARRGLVEDDGNEDDVDEGGDGGKDDEEQQEEEIDETAEVD